MLWRSPGMVAKLRTVNMSLGGARVYSDDRLKLGRKLHLELLAGPDSTVQVLARVVWIDDLPPGGPARYDVGLEFLDVPEEMTSRLAAILQKDEDFKRQIETPTPRDRVWEDEEDDEEQPNPSVSEKKQ
jgi:PilZ domain